MVKLRKHEKDQHVSDIDQLEKSGEKGSDLADQINDYLADPEWEGSTSDKNVEVDTLENSSSGFSSDKLNVLKLEWKLSTRDQAKKKSTCF